MWLSKICECNIVTKYSARYCVPLILYKFPLIDFTINARTSVHLIAKRIDRCQSLSIVSTTACPLEQIVRDHALFKCYIIIQLRIDDEQCVTELKARCGYVVREPHSLLNFNAVPPAVIWLLKVAAYSRKVRSTCALLWAHILSRILLHQTIA